MIKMARPNLGKEEEAAVLQVLRSGQLSQGKMVASLEKKFAKLIGTKYAVATSSGTTALHLSLLAAGIEAEDEVVTIPFSFIASANCCLYVRAKPVFVDIRPDDFTINADLIEAAITKKTKAIIPVHIFGCPAEMDKITKIAKKYQLKIIEDCCQAHGAVFKNKKVGNWGLAGCWSFYPTKNMICGEGGMITTNDKKLAEKCILLRSHGSPTRYFHDILGFNFRMGEMEAAIALEQLKKLWKVNKQRQTNAKTLLQLIKVKGIILPEFKQSRVWHQFTIRVTKNYFLSRNELRKKLYQAGVETEIYYPLPIHKQPLYKKLGYKNKLPVAESATQEVLSLPIQPRVTKKDLLLIAKVINKGR